MTVRDLLMNGESSFLESGISSATALLGLAPIAALGLAGYSGNVQSFQSAIRSPISPNTRSVKFGSAVGAAAKAREEGNKIQRQRRAKVVKEKIENTLLKSEILQNIQQNQQKRNALIQSFAHLLDDPNVNFPEDTKNLLRTALNSAATDIDYNMQDLVDQIVTPLVNSNNESALTTLSRLRSNYAGVDNLVPATGGVLPEYSVELVTGYKPSQYELKVRDELLSMLGKDHDVVIRNYNDMNMNFSVAQVFTKGKNGNSWQLNVPLPGKDHDATGFYRTGQFFQTPNTVPTYILDATNSSTLLGNARSVKDLDPITYTDFMMSQLRQESARTGRINWTSFRSNMSEVLQNIPRAVSDDSLFGRHLRMQTSLRGKRTYVHNLGALNTQQQIAYQQNLGKIPDVDVLGAGGKNIISRTGDNTIRGSTALTKYSVLGIYQRRFGGTIKMNQNGVITDTQLIDRNVARGGAREYQVLGREKMVVENVRKFGVSSNIQIGGAIDIYGTGRGLGTAFNPLERAATGGVVRPLVISFDPENILNKNVTDQGFAYMGRDIDYVEPISPTLIDAKRSNLPFESAALKELREAGPSGIEYTKPAYLGDTGAGLYSIPFTSRTQSVRLRYKHTSDIRVSGGTKSQTFLTGERRKSSDLVKLFSSDFKGQSKTVSPATLERQIGMDTRMSSMFKAYGISIEDVVAATPDMMKKGSMPMISFMTSAAIAASPGALSQEQIVNKVLHIAEQYANGTYSSNDKYFNLLKSFKDDNRVIGYYTAAILDESIGKGADPFHLGTSLTGVWFSKRAKLGFANESSNDLIADELDTLADVLYGKNSQKAISMKEGLRYGKSLGVLVASVGEGLEDWGRGRGSLEARAGMALFENFESMGFGQEKAAKIVSRLYNNKIGFSESVRFITEMQKFVGSITGQYSASDYLKEVKNGVQRYSYNDFTVAMVNNNEGILGMIKDSEKGFVIDMENAPSNIKNAVSEAFGGTELRIPGRELLESAKGTQIKLTGGDTKQIDSLVAGLFGNLADILGSPKGTVDQLTESLKDFRKETNSLFADAVTTTLSGKIRGSASPIASLINLGDAGEWTGGRLEKARKLYSRSDGRLAFLDSDAFLSQMLDMETDLSFNRRSKLMRMFFSSMEYDKLKKQQGITMALGRHPQLTSANMFLSDVYRNPEEIATLGGRDLLFEKFKESETGQKLLRKYVGGPRRVGSLQSFGDVLKHTDGKYIARGDKKISMTRAFFDDFTRNLKQFYKFEASGKVILPALFDKAGEDISQWVAAYGDFDGDHAIAFHFSESEASSINKVLRNNKEFAANDLLFRKFVTKMGKQSKLALQNIAERMHKTLGTNMPDNLAEDIAKEVGLSIKTGPLDVSFRGLHNALFDNSKNVTDAMFNRGILGVLTEQFVIKAKKLPVATQFDEALRAGVNRLMTDGNDDMIRSVMKDIFQGTDLDGRGVTVDLEDLKSFGPEFSQLAELQGSRTFTVDSIVDDWLDAARMAIQNGTNTKMTSNAFARELEENPARALQMLALGQNAQSAVVSAFTKESNVQAKAAFAMSQTKSMLSNLDKVFTGKVALGLTAGAFAVGMLGRDYSPEPIIMPGESRPSDKIATDMRSGNLFTDNDLLMQGNDYPVNTPDFQSQNLTYMDKPNAYQVRGDIPQNSNIGSIISQFSSITGGMMSGSISINDTRRPITQNYVDRMLGEY